MEAQKFPIEKTILSKNRNDKVLTILNLKLYYTATKTPMVLGQNRNVDHWNRIEDPGGKILTATAI
jgi:hypothetical protein